MTVSDPTPAGVAAATLALGAFLSDREPTWAEKVMRCAGVVQAGNPEGLTDFLSLHGGIGSLNDLTFDPSNGNVDESERADELSEAFRRLDDEAYSLADIAARQAGQPRR